jgi:hypothetical protein
VQAQDSARAAREAGEAAAAASGRAAEHAAEAMREGIAAVTQAAQEAAQAMRESVGTAVGDLRAAIAGLSSTMRTVEAAFATQTRSVETVSLRSRETAEAFGQVAQNVRAASQPLLASSDRISSATEIMAKSMESSVTALTSSQETSSALATRLQGHLDNAGIVLESYERRFAAVDEELGRAVERFAEETGKQQDRTRQFTIDLDRDLSKSVDKLAGMVSDLRDANEDLAEHLSLVSRSSRLQPAE